MSERREGLTDGQPLKERIREAAHACGFDQVGFAPADTPRHGVVYQEWLDRGFHGEMAYMAREDAVRRRLDPGELMPNARTLVMVSLVYGPGSGASGDSPTVARYAGGLDYHDVFEERLDTLADAIRDIAPGTNTRRYVDYGPVLERDHAQRAGLGWIGKNTMLIHPRLGSYLMLAELVTDLEVEPDEPFLPDRCGTCTRCIEACPTDAILDGRLLDARQCISYLTIELRGPIPVELRAPIGTRVFGCDICQEVCPWNSDAPTPETSPFAPVPIVTIRKDSEGGGAGTGADVPGRPVAFDDLIAWAEEVISLDADGFKARYRGTAFARPGRDGLLRNLAVGLGNTGDPACIPVLKRLSRDDSELVAEHARWGLERVGGSGR